MVYKQPLLLCSILVILGMSVHPVLATPVTAGLQLWLDATDAATVIDDGSGFVEIWQDKSPNGFHATQTVAGGRPVHQPAALGGQSTIRFDGVNDGMDIADGLVVGRPYTAFIVDQYYGATQGRTLQSRDINWLAGKWRGGNAHFANGWVGAQNALTAGTLAPVVGEAIGASTASGSRYYVSGTHRTADPAPTGAPGRLGLMNGFANEQSNADVSEVIVYNRVLTKMERHTVGFYLAGKYGLTTGYSPASNFRSASIHAFTGADAGEGLDLEGDFAYAVNVGGGDSTVGSLTFTDNTNTPGLTLSANNHIPAWINAPDYGASGADDGLETVMHSIRWSGFNQPINDVNIDMAVVQGQQYKLQLLFSENILNRPAGSRVIDMMVDGREIAEYMDVNGVMGTFSGTIDAGAAVTYLLTASGNNLNVRLGSAAEGQDLNPILNGLTLEVIPEPSSFALLLVSGLVLLTRRSVWRRG